MDERRKISGGSILSLPLFFSLFSLFSPFIPPSHHPFEALAF
jgi:hypothetical protein